jgi:hypothetical protein
MSRHNRTPNRENRFENERAQSLMTATLRLSHSTLHRNRGGDRSSSPQTKLRLLPSCKTPWKKRYSTVVLTSIQAVPRSVPRRGRPGGEIANSEMMRMRSTKLNAEACPAQQQPDEAIVLRAIFACTKLGINSLCRDFGTDLCPAKLTEVQTKCERPT